jgi:subtilin transport ATP-binding protein spaT
MTTLHETDRSNASSLQLFFRLSRELLKISPVCVVLAILLAFLQGVLPSLSLLIMEWIMNNVQLSTVSVYQIVLLCALYIGIEIIILSTSTFQNYLSFIINKKVDFKFCMWLLRKVSNLELIDFEISETNDLINRAKEQLNGKIVPAYMAYIGVLQSFVFLISNLLVLVRSISVSVIFPIVFLAAIHSIAMFRLSKVQYDIIRARTNDARKMWYLQYLLTNDIAFKEIKIYNAFNYLAGKYRAIFFGFLKTDKKIQQSFTVTDFVLSLLGQLYIGGVFFDAILGICQGRYQMGTALAYIKSVINIRNSTQSIFSQITSIKKQSYYLNQLFELLDYQSKSIPFSGSKKLSSIQNIEFKNVTFSYPNRQSPVLIDVNVKLQKGDSIILEGANGSGKSTFLKILAGYYSDYKGTILVDGIDIRDIDIQSYRSCIGILLQDFVKYEMSIAENLQIGMGNKESEITDIKAMLKEYGLPGYFYDDPDKQLGYWFKGGTQISGGQWLKIALCRTMARNSTVVLLDEFNAALDEKSALSIWNKIQQQRSDKIIISSIHHKEGMNLDNQRILYFSGGNVKELTPLQT